MNFLKYIFFICSLLFINGCGFSGGYGLSGSSILPEWKTLNVVPFSNYALLQNPSLAQDLNLSLQDVFRSRTNLNLTDQEDADLIIEGEITDYNVTPLSIQNNDVAAENRLTITVKIRYINNVDEKKSFERSFTAYENFPGTQALSDVESTIVPTVVDLIRDQVFAAIALDW